MTPLPRAGLAFCLIFGLVAPVARALPAPPGEEPGNDTVIVEEGTPGGPLEVVEQTPPPQATQGLSPAPEQSLTPEQEDRLWRASRGLGIERWGTILGPIGIATSMVGIALIAQSETSDERASGRMAVYVGYGIAGTFQLIGGSGAIVASRQLRHLGVARHRSGLATASFVLSIVPGTQFVGWLLMVVHRRMTLNLCRRLPRSPNGPSFAFQPWIDPAHRGYGTGLVVRF